MNLEYAVNLFISLLINAATKNLFTNLFFIFLFLLHVQMVMILDFNLLKIYIYIF